MLGGGSGQPGPGFVIVPGSVAASCKDSTLAAVGSVCVGLGLLLCPRSGGSSRLFSPKEEEEEEEACLLYTAPRAEALGNASGEGFLGGFSLSYYSYTDKHLVGDWNGFVQTTNKKNVSQSFGTLGFYTELAANPRPREGATSEIVSNTATAHSRVGSREHHTSIQTERAAAVTRNVSRTVAGDGVPGDGCGRPGPGLL